MPPNERAEMSVVIVEYKVAWGGGNALVTAREKALVTGIGEQMPRWLFEVMAEVWEESVIEKISVVFKPLPPETINVPDVWITVKFGKKWHELHEHATTELGIRVQEWLDGQLTSQMEPSTIIVVELVDWHGVEFDPQGRPKNRW